METWDEELEEMSYKKRGRPYKFPESFMTFLAFVHVAFLPFRQMEGFLRKLSEYIPKLKAADYSTICKRLQKMNIDLPLQDVEEDVIIALDSSGMKVSNRGEWIRDKWKVRKGWIKVHIAVDVKTKKLLAMEITDEGVADGKMLKPLVKKAKKNIGNKKIKRVYGDGAYDMRENFNYLNSEEIEPVIKIRKNASTKAKASMQELNMLERGKRVDMKYGRINTNMDKDGLQRHSYQELKEYLEKQLKQRLKKENFRK